MRTTNTTLPVLLCSTLLGLAAHNAAAQTATNTCIQNAGNKYATSPDCAFVPFNKPDAFTASFDPGASCSGSLHDDAWGWFTATTNTTVITFDPDDNHRPILHVFSGTCANLVSIGCHNSGSNGVNAQVSVATTPGQHYIIRVQRHSSNLPMTGMICIAAPPNNDACANAITLPLTTNCSMQTYSTAGSTPSTGLALPSCGGATDNAQVRDVWFKFTAPANGVVQIETQAGTLTDAVMKMYSGSCATPVPMECNDSTVWGQMPSIDRRCMPLTGGVNYLLRVYGKSGSTGTFGICIREYPMFTYMQEDCAGAGLVCNNQSIVNASVDKGCFDDLTPNNRGCLISNERRGSWYRFSPSTSGTIAFTITPLDANDQLAPFDHDFAIWGPLNELVCPPPGNPIRCSYASPTTNGNNIGAGTFLTGLAAGHTDFSEPAYNVPGNMTVNGFVAPLMVQPADVGKLYILYVDDFQRNGQNFRLDWALTEGASLGCTLLPVELSEFGATPGIDHVAVDWVTLSEQNSHHFAVERSPNGILFSTVGTITAAGSSNLRTEYRFTDSEPLLGQSYYRLRQVDIDGREELSITVAVTFQGHGDQLLMYPNPANDRLTIELPAGLSGRVELAVMDNSGRLIRTIMHQLDGYERRLELPVRWLEPGLYTVALRTPGRAAFKGRFIRN
jgi:hypothetical protein